MGARGLHALRKLANKCREEEGLPPDKSPVEASALARKVARYPRGRSRPFASFSGVRPGLFAECPHCGAGQFASNAVCRKCGRKLEG